jgi:hypothetical protein
MVSCFPESGGLREPCPLLTPTIGNTASKRISLRSSTPVGSASIGELPATPPCKGLFFPCLPASSPVEDTRQLRFAIASSIPPPVDAAAHNAHKGFNFNDPPQRSERRKQCWRRKPNSIGEYLWKHHFHTAPSLPVKWYAGAALKRVARRRSNLVTPAGRR